MTAPVRQPWLRRRRGPTSRPSVIRPARCQPLPPGAPRRRGIRGARAVPLRQCPPAARGTAIRDAPTAASPRRSRGGEVTARHRPPQTSLACRPRGREEAADQSRRRARGGPAREPRGRRVGHQVPRRLQLPGQPGDPRGQSPGHRARPCARSPARTCGSPPSWPPSPRSGSRSRDEDARILSKDELIRVLKQEFDARVIDDGPAHEALDKPRRRR